MDAFDQLLDLSAALPGTGLDRHRESLLFAAAELRALSAECGPTNGFVRVIRPEIGSRRHAVPAAA